MCATLICLDVQLIQPSTQVVSSSLSCCGKVVIARRLCWSCFYGVVTLGRSPELLVSRGQGVHKACIRSVPLPWFQSIPAEDQTDRVGSGRGIRLSWNVRQCIFMFSDRSSCSQPRRALEQWRLRIHRPSLQWHLFQSLIETMWTQEAYRYQPLGFCWVWLCTFKKRYLSRPTNYSLGWVLLALNVQNLGRFACPISWWGAWATQFFCWWPDHLQTPKEEWARIVPSSL